ncbi:uncharacterized protein LOC107266451 isoform X2 [Cephus cinctus]|nr:uncharacterized protein LOC107266451 isoform X2 [Cephus cinctus]
MPAMEFVSVVEGALWKMKKEEVYSLLMDEALTPCIPSISDSTPFITTTEWSPSGLMHPSKCLLGIVTSVGAAVVLFNISTSWYQLIDVSSLWYTQIQETFPSYFTNSSDIKISHSVLTKNLRRLQATCITWSKLFTSNNSCYAYFSTAYRSSDLAVWKVFKVSHQALDATPTLVYTMQTNVDSKINLMTFNTLKNNKHLLIIGYINGLIHGVLLNETEGTLKMQSCQKYYNCADRISVNCIELLHQDQYVSNILITKGSILIFLKLNSDGILLDMQHIQLGTFSISGLTVTGKDQAYITTQDGALISLYIQNTKITTKRINHSTSQAQLQQYLGLSCSPNKILFVNVTSPNSMYDHLVIREPSKVSLFTLEAKEFDPVSLLYENPSRTLKNHWDCLETIRLTAAKSENFSKVFPKVPTNLESLPLYELRIAMWISTMLDICKKKDLLKRSQIVVEISEAQPLVFIHCAIDILERLKKKTSLSKDNKICIRLLRSYLEVYLAGEEDDEDTNLTQLVKETLKDTAHMSTPENELCTLCGEVISDLSWNVTRCPSGHQIPRCARSLLQISSVQYRSCPFCGLLLHPWLDEEYEEPLCPYCQVPALYDGRVLSVSDTNGIPFLNLSERRRTIQPPGKTQGSENVSKGHLRRPRTFAVVVNNEEDDACNITETWQEF